MQNNLKTTLDSLKDRHIVHKLWISGGPGVGKTALIHGLVGELKWRNKLVEWIDEVIRDCPYPIDKGADFKTEMWVIEHQHAKEVAKMRHMPDFLLCDRGMLDQAVYGTMLFNDKKLTEKEYHILLNTVLDWMKTYEFGILVSPTEKEMTKDGFRATGKGYQWEMHNYFVSVLDALGAKYVVISGSHEERIKMAIEAMKSMNVLK